MYFDKPISDEAAAQIAREIRARDAKEAGTMSDIVEVLRSQFCDNRCPSNPGDCTCKIAADEIERLRGIRENLNRYMPTARLDLVDEERCCTECQGSGIKTYGTSATWRGGSGGMTLTTDVCNKCWGSGDANRPWPSHREIERLRAALQEIADRHVPDQPASSCDEAEYVRSHHTALRRMALAALINTL
jgi:hypothetical protein